MAVLKDLAGSVEFWMGLSLLAAALPGPQTRWLPALFRAVANGLKRRGARDNAKR